MTSAVMSEILDVAAVDDASCNVRDIEIAAVDDVSCDVRDIGVAAVDDVSCDATVSQLRLLI